MRTVSDWKQTEGQSHNIGGWCNGSMCGSNPFGQSSNLWSPVSILECVGQVKLKTQDNKSENKNLRESGEISLPRHLG